MYSYPRPSKISTNEGGALDLIGALATADRALAATKKGNAKPKGLRLGQLDEMQIWVEGTHKDIRTAQHNTNLGRGDFAQHNTTGMRNRYQCR